MKRKRRNERRKMWTRVRRKTKLSEGEEEKKGEEKKGGRANSVNGERKQG